MAKELSFRSAAKIAYREMHSSRDKFFFVILSVAIGVAALTGVRGFSTSFRATLLTRARSIMAGDLAARSFQQPTPEQQKELDQIAAEGVTITPVTELLSMASAPVALDPLLVSLKAVDPAEYPFYGTVQLAPAGRLADALRADTVVVADDLLVRLKLKIGDRLKLGNTDFRIAAVVVNEPDRLSGSFAAGPRVLISREGLEASGLLAPGSHAGQRFLFKVPLPGYGTPISDKAVSDLKARLIKLLPEAQVSDYRETNPALTQGLDRATSLLSLMSLVALVLGAIGVAMAMRAHLAERLDTIAIMKSLGARSAQIVKIYLLQTLLLGVGGGLLGVVMGVGVQRAFPVLLAKLIDIHTDLPVQPRAVLTGLAAGILTTLLFTLPPLLDIRGVRPILILRRNTETAEEEEVLSLRTRLRRRLPWVALAAVFSAGFDAWLHFGRPGHALEAALVTMVALAGAGFGPQMWWRARKNPMQIGAFALILGGLTLIAMRVSDSAIVGRAFAVGLVIVLIVLLGASAGVLAGLKYFLNRTRLSLPAAVRHGLANLYRPGNPSAALLAALGMGVMQIATVFLVQQAVVKELHLASAPNLPNVFLVDISNEEIGGMRALLKAQKSVEGEPEMLPVVTSRILAIDGVAASEVKLKNFPRRMLQSISLTYSDSLPPGTKVMQGGWWTAAQAEGADKHPLVALGERHAEWLGVHVGSTVTFAAQDTQFTATVAAVVKSDGQHAYSRAEFILPPKSLAGLPTIWYGGVHADPAHVSELQRALYAAFPTVTVINVAQALETVRSVVIQITYVVQFLAAFSIFAGVIILASSIAGTKYRRVREVVVLKTLGATRARIVSIFSIEFAVLGLVSGLVGVFFANVIARTLLHQMTIVYQTGWGWSLGALLGTAGLTVATGWMASHRLLGQKPLEILREE